MLSGTPTDNFSQIFRQHHRNIYSLLLRMTQNSADAEDLTQEVFIKLHGCIGSFREESKLSTWLYRIAYNQAIDFLRKKKVRDYETVPVESVYIAQPEESDEEGKTALLLEALKGLTTEETALITLFYMDKKSTEEISGITSLSVSNVKTKLHRIRKKIYEQLKETYHE